MTNSASGIQREIKVKGQNHGMVTSCKYLWTIVTDDGSEVAVLSRIAEATTALTKLKSIWRDDTVSLGSKEKHAVSCHISSHVYMPILAPRL